MIELFNLKTLLGNPGLNFSKFKESLIQYTTSTAQYHHEQGLFGYFLPDFTWLALNSRQSFRLRNPSCHCFLSLRMKQHSRVLNAIGDATTISLPE